MNDDENIEYIPYMKLIDYLDVKKGDIVYIASQILGLAFNCKKHGETFDANLFIDSIQNKIGKQGTILIPTFNWDFSNYGYYDYNGTVCTTGSLGITALKREDFIRTKHPMQSFAVWGKDKDILVDMNNIDSYDENSPFEYMFKKHAKCLIIGTDYKHALTFIHYVEKKVTVRKSL